MGSFDYLVDWFKNTYYFFEDKWYGGLDKIDSKVPIYKVIDKVDEVIPSFILFLLFILLLIFISGYFIQFNNPIGVTFNTIDATNNAPLANVDIKTVILTEVFEQRTDSRGELTILVDGVQTNIYENIIAMFLGTREIDLSIQVNASKDGYQSFSRTFESGREHIIKLSPIPDETPPKATFKSSTRVRLEDRDTGQTIIDNTGSAYVKFNCENKSIQTKTIYSYTGIFDLQESECHFRIEEAYSPGYIRFSNTSTLPTNIDIHPIKLTKMSTTGSARIWVFEENTTNPIAGAKVTINEKFSTTNNSGSAIIDNLPAGEYEIFITKDEYYPINGGPENEIEIFVNDITEKDLFLQPMDPELARKVHLKVVDFDTKKGVSGAKVTLRKLNDNNIPGGIINSQNTDTNGLFDYRNFSVNDINKIIAIIENKDHVLKILKPELLEFDLNPQTIEIKKADHTNSGQAKTYVRSDSGNINRPLQNATVNLLIKEFNGILNIPTSSKITDSNGYVDFSNLPIDLNYLARASYEGVSVTSQESKELDANQTIIFNLTIGLDIAKIIVDVKNNVGENIDDATVKLYHASSDFSSLEFKETLEKINNEFHSGLYSISENYHIQIDANNYVSSTITIDKQINPLRKGTNKFEKILKLNDNEIIDPISLDGNIMILWKDIYKTNDLMWSDNSTANIIYDGNVYRAQIDIIISDENIDYNTLLGMIRTKNAFIENIYVNPQYGLTRTVTASCSNEELDEEESRAQGYYLITKPNCGGDNKIVAGAKWSSKEIEDINLPKGEYSIAIDFRVNQNDADEVIFWFRAKEERENIYTETPLKEKRIPIGIPFREGVFLEAKINNNIINFSQNRGLVNIDADEENDLEIILHNKSNEFVLDAKVSVYSHRGAISNFSEINESLSGDVYFGEDFDVKTKVLGENITIPLSSDIKLETEFKILGLNASNYLVIVFEHGENKETYFIDITTGGKRIIVLHAQFLSGVSNQLFSGTISSIREGGDPVIDSMQIKVYKKDDSDPVFSSTNVPLKEDKKSFEIEIPGNYVSGDYLDLIINAKERGTNEFYNEYNKRFYAGAHSTTDRELACVDIYHPNYNKKLTLDWDNTVKLNIINLCNREVTLFVETALVCNYENDDDCLIRRTLNPNEEISIDITGKNKTFDSTIEAPNFSDLLGFFPVNVKARFENRNLFSNASLFEINLINTKQCFEILGWPSYDFSENTQKDIQIKNYCFYRNINNYFIPTINLQAFGYEINPKNIEEQNTLTFDVTLDVEGPQRTFSQQPQKREEWVGINTIYAEDIEEAKKVDHHGLTKYLVTFDLSETLNQYNSVFGNAPTDWFYDKIQIRITDINYFTDNYGAKIDGQIKLTYQNGQTEFVNPAGNFQLTPFRGINTNSNIYTGSGEDFWGDAFIQGESDDIYWFAGIFYQPINNKKISQIDINFIGPGDNYNEFLEFTIRLQIVYEEVIFTENPPGESTGDNLKIGEYSIPKIGGVNFIITTIQNLRDNKFFENEIFINRVNPNLTGINSSNSDVVVWVENGFVFARYKGESPYISSSDSQIIDGKIKKLIGTGNIYGIINVVDYVRTKPASERIISGDAS